MKDDSRSRVARMQAPKGHCRACQKPVPKGRKSWCSDACVQSAWIKLSPAFARTKVHQRDKGVCAECGFDADQALRVLNRLRYGKTGVGYRADYGDTREREDAITVLVNVWTQPKRPHTGRIYNLPHLWEADHIVPVVEGGGACELENYRTLCVPCHREVTRELAARRARARQDAKRIEQEAQNAERLRLWQRHASPQSADAVDPHVDSTGKPTPRA